MLTSVDLDFSQMRQQAKRSANLSTVFFETDTYRLIRKRLVKMLLAREERLREGLNEQTALAVIGGSGSGKTTMLERAISECEKAMADHQDFRFGTRIVSVIVPGQASVKDTCRAVLKEIGYPTESARSEDQLMTCLVAQMKHRGIAALHLDEVQDAGRFGTTEAKESFTKRFRNLTQSEEWPVCLILSGTAEARDFVNQNFTLTRRVRPIEIPPMSFEVDGQVLRSCMADLLGRAGLKHNGLFEVEEFIRICIHAAVARFGIAIELTIEAIEDAQEAGDMTIDMGHFAEAYRIRTDCDEALNPFLSERWNSIDTMTAMQRHLEKGPIKGKAGRR